MVWRDEAKARGAAPPVGYRYPWRTTFLKPEEQEEFGFATVSELVAALNRAWAKEGRLPLAPGSFPTSRVRVPFVLNEARLARLRGSLELPEAASQPAPAGQ